MKASTLETIKMDRRMDASIKVKPIVFHISQNVPTGFSGVCAAETRIKEIYVINGSADCGPFACMFPNKHSRQ